MESRWRWVAVGLVLVLAAAGGTAYVVSRPSSSPSSHRPVTGPPPVVRAAALTAVPVEGVSAASGAGVAAALARAVADPAFGGSLAGSVADAATGEVLLDRDSGTPMTPASTVKLLTAAVALTTLGPAATLRTTVLRAGSTLYLRGGGDVTLLARPAPATAYPRPADLTTLAKATAKALAPAGGAITRVCADVSRWTGPSSAPGWNPGYFTGGDIESPSALEVDEGRLSRTSSARVEHPAHAALASFTAALKAAGVPASRSACIAAAPAGASVVASVQSPPVAALVTRMLTDSDNDLAEALGRAVATASGRPASFAGEAAALTVGLARLDVPIDGLRLVDASGLSRLDRVSAVELVTALRDAIGRPSLRPLLAGLPVAAATGTLAKRFRSRATSAGAGVVRAKTGTLAGVNSLAGTVVDADGRLLVFAFLTDRAASPSKAEAALDRLAAILAGCGCRS
jgi:D-alanyl-D-alanine carboxypeptidase/D-alanyl-D-alanine-endopeptidase (penicillin-binding protein 4)